MDYTPNLVPSKKESNIEKSENLLLKLDVPAMFKNEKNEATSPRSREIENIEAKETNQKHFMATWSFGTPATRFPLFSKLPAEVRLIIWREALPGPRLVEVDFHFKNPACTFGSVLTSCTPRTLPPAMLGACVESRAEALKRYSLCFGVGNSQPKTYFDKGSDNLLITSEDIVNLLQSLEFRGALRIPTFQCIRNLALCLCPDLRDYDPVDYLFLMQHLRGMESLTLVVHERRNCGTEWQDKDLDEVETEEEPSGHREHLTAVMEDRTLWIPGSWRSTPTLRFKRLKEI